jgi:4-hydroxy-2-oxoheptanedioate aldolase
MIEKKDSVENLEAILSVYGIDMVHFCPADFALSNGWSRGSSADALREVEHRVIESALRHGVHPRAEIADPRQAAEYLELGVSHFCIGHDVLILNNWWLERGRQMRSLLAEVAPGAHIMKAP